MRSNPQYIVITTTWTDLIEPLRESRSKTLVVYKTKTLTVSLEKEDQNTEEFHIIIMNAFSLDRSHFKVCFLHEQSPFFSSIVMPGAFSRRSVKKTGAGVVSDA